MKSIDFRVMHFLILYPLLSRLALWIERRTVKVEIVGSVLAIYNIFKKIFSFFFYHKSCSRLARFLQDLRIKVNVIEFILKHYNYLLGTV